VGTCSFGEVFQTGNTGSLSLSAANFSLFKFGSPTANLIAYLFKASIQSNLAVPTGLPLAQSANMSTTILPKLGSDCLSTPIGSSGTPNQFLFSGANQISLSPNTWYVIAVMARQGGTLGGSNCWKIGIQTSGSTYSGSAVQLITSSWSNLKNAGFLQDLFFTVYGFQQDCQSSNCLDLYLNVPLAAGLIGLVCMGTAVIYGGGRVIGDKELAWVGFSLVLIVLGIGLLLVWAQG